MYTFREENENTMIRESPIRLLMVALGLHQQVIFLLPHLKGGGSKPGRDECGWGLSSEAGGELHCISFTLFSVLGVTQTPGACKV